MIQTTTGLLVIGWKLAVAIIAGIPILTTLGVFLLARFTSVFDAYAGERAKLLAQFHNLDKLVEQTEKLTVATESIRTRMSEDVWGRQQRWLKRMDAYVDVVAKLDAYADATYELRALHQQLSDFTGPHDELYLHLLTGRGEAFGKYNLAVSAYTRARITAELTCDKKTMTLLRVFALPKFDLDNLDSKLDHAAQVALGVSKVFVAAARTEAGYEQLDLDLSGTSDKVVTALRHALAQLPTQTGRSEIADDG